MFKNVASQKIALFAFDATTNVPKTGDAANITAYVSKDHGAVTVLGDTTATEFDATNAPGWYWFDVTQAETNADNLMFTGKSSTANIKIVGRALTTLPANFGATSINSSGQVDVIKVAGTTQTARDLGASVLISSGTGTGQLDVTSGVIKANLAQILGTALTETAGLLAGGFKKFFNVASPTLTCLGVDQTGDSYVRLGAPAGASVSADVAAIKTDTGNLVTRITSTLFSGITSLAQWLGLLAGKQVGNTTARTELRATGAGSGTFDETTDSQEAIRDNMGTAQTGDSYARLGAPAGASVSADIAAAKADTAAIKAKTDSLTFTVAGMVDSNVVDWKGATAPAMTGDAFARLGAPAGASVSADIAAAKADTAAILDDTGTSGVVVAAASKTGFRLSAPGVGDILTTALTESYAADGAAPTLSQAIFAIQQMMQERAISTTTMTIKKLDGTTTAMTFTLDDATNPTSITRAT